ncbi:hypothetical protein ACJEI6_25400, partial [Escherichia coli]
SIVKRIAALHGMRVSLGNAPEGGFAVTVSWYDYCAERKRLCTFCLFFRSVLARRIPGILSSSRTNNEQHSDYQRRERICAL